MSLCASLNGRKKESMFWKFFEFVKSKNSSKCIVKNDKGLECGFMLSGKNPSNLKRHLVEPAKKCIPMLGDFSTGFSFRACFAGIC